MKNKKKKSQINKFIEKGYAIVKLLNNSEHLKLKKKNSQTN